MKLLKKYYTKLLFVLSLIVFFAQGNLVMAIDVNLNAQTEEGSADRSLGAKIKNFLLSYPKVITGVFGTVLVTVIGLGYLYKKRKNSIKDPENIDNNNSSIVNKKGNKNIVIEGYDENNSINNNTNINNGPNTENKDNASGTDSQDNKNNNVNGVNNVELNKNGNNNNNTNTNNSDNSPDTDRQDNINNVEENNGHVSNTDSQDNSIDNQNINNAEEHNDHVSNTDSQDNSIDNQNINNAEEYNGHVSGTDDVNNNQDLPDTETNDNKDNDNAQDADDDIIFPSELEKITQQGFVSNIDKKTIKSLQKYLDDLKFRKGNINKYIKEIKNDISKSETEKKDLLTELKNEKKQYKVDMLLGIYALKHYVETGNTDLIKFFNRAEKNSLKVKFTNQFYKVVWVTGDNGYGSYKIENPQGKGQHVEFTVQKKNFVGGDSEDDPKEETKKDSVIEYVKDILDGVVQNKNENVSNYDILMKLSFLHPWIKQNQFWHLIRKKNFKGYQFYYAIEKYVYNAITNEDEAKRIIYLKKLLRDKGLATLFGEKTETIASLFEEKVVVVKSNDNDQANSSVDKNKGKAAHVNDKINSVIGGLQYIIARLVKVIVDNELANNPNGKDGLQREYESLLDLMLMLLKVKTGNLKHAERGAIFTDLKTFSYLKVAQDHTLCREKGFNKDQSVNFLAYAFQSQVVFNALRNSYSAIQGMNIEDFYQAALKDLSNDWKYTLQIKAVIPFTEMTYNKDLPKEKTGHFKDRVVKLTNMLKNQDHISDNLRANLSTEIIAMISYVASDAVANQSDNVKKDSNSLLNDLKNLLTVPKAKEIFTSIFNPYRKLVSYHNKKASIYNHALDVIVKNEETDKIKIIEDIFVELGQDKNEVKALLNRDFLKQVETGKIAAISDDATQYVNARLGKIQDLEEKEVIMLLRYALLQAYKAGNTDKEVIIEGFILGNPTLQDELLDINSQNINLGDDNWGSIYDEYSWYFNQINNTGNNKGDVNNAKTDIKKIFKKRVSSFLKNNGKSENEIEVLLHEKIRKQFEQNGTLDIEKLKGDISTKVLGYVQERIDKIKKANTGQKIQGYEVHRFFAYLIKEWIGAIEANNFQEKSNQDSDKKDENENQNSELENIEKILDNLVESCRIEVFVPVCGIVDSPNVTDGSIYEYIQNKIQKFNGQINLKTILDKVNNILTPKGYHEGEIKGLLNSHSIRRNYSMNGYLYFTEIKDDYIGPFIVAKLKRVKTLSQIEKGKIFLNALITLLNGNNDSILEQLLKSDYLMKDNEFRDAIQSVLIGDSNSPYWMIIDSKNKLNIATLIHSFFSKNEVSKSENLSADMPTFMKQVFNFTDKLGIKRVRVKRWIYPRFDQVLLSESPEELKAVSINAEDKLARKFDQAIKEQLWKTNLEGKDLNNQVNKIILHFLSTITYSLKNDPTKLAKNNLASEFLKKETILKYNEANQKLEHVKLVDYLKWFDPVFYDDRGLS